MLGKDNAASYAEHFVRKLKSIKNYSKTSLTVCVLSQWEKHRWGLTSFDQIRKCGYF